MITASYDLAACVTALAIIPFTFRIGRRGTILMGNFVAVFGAIIQASSFSVGQLIAGRLVTGFAIGCISSAVPTYLSETGVEIGDRGPANALNAILLISGVPLAYWVDYGFTKMDNQASWRVPIALQCSFAFFSGGCMWFLPGKFDLVTKARATHLMMIRYAALVLRAQSLGRGRCRTCTTQRHAGRL